MMNEKWKRIISVLLAVCIAVSLSLFAYASSSENGPDGNDVQYTEYSLQDMREMALNALVSDFPMEADAGTWEDVEILKETPLYDIEGKLASYCFDLKCQEQNSYIVISATSKNYPIMQFASHASSQYLEIDDSINSIYIGPGQYYIEDGEGNSVVDLVSGETVEIEDIGATTNYRNEVVEDFSDIAQLYISGDILKQPMSFAGEVTYKKLTGVPEYEWHLSCAPTAMAMILAYHYSGFTEESLIEELAKNMETKSPSTPADKVPKGTTKTLSAHNKSYTSVGYASTGLFGIINWGGSNNTFDDYRDEILANRPVFIAMVGAEGTSPAYENGFGDHAVTGVGFNSTSTVTYVIVHTTAKSDHAVSVPLNSTSLGKYAWCFVVP